MTWLGPPQRLYGRGGSCRTTAAVGPGSGPDWAAACSLRPGWLAGWRVGCHRVGWGREGEGCQTDVLLPRRRPERPRRFRVGGRAGCRSGRRGAPPDVGPVSPRGQVQPGGVWRRPCLAPWL